jgi:hypothetical protein
MKRLVLLFFLCGFYDGFGEVFERGDAGGDLACVQRSVGNDLHELDATEQVKLQRWDWNDPAGGVGDLLSESAALVENGSSDFNAELAVCPAVFCTAGQPSTESGSEDADANADEGEKLRDELLLEREWSHAWRNFAIGIVTGLFLVPIAQFLMKR